MASRYLARSRDLERSAGAYDITKMKDVVPQGLLSNSRRENDSEMSFSVSHSEGPESFHMTWLAAKHSTVPLGAGRHFMSHQHTVLARVSADSGLQDGTQEEGRSGGWGVA